MTNPPESQGKPDQQAPATQPGNRPQWQVPPSQLENVAATTSAVPPIASVAAPVPQPLPVSPAQPMELDRAAMPPAQAAAPAPVEETFFEKVSDEISETAQEIGDAVESSVDAVQEVFEEQTPDASNAEERTLEQVVDAILAMPARDKITFREFIDLFGEQSMFLALFLFALPVAIPFIGADIFMSVLGLPICIIGYCMITGGHKVWVPEFVSRKEIEYPNLLDIMRAARKVLTVIRPYIKPRILVLSSEKAEKVMGGTLIALSLSLFFFSHMVTDVWIAPAIALFGFGMIFRDGTILALAWVCTAMTYLAGFL